jgi:hypothetical protein
LVEGIGQRRPLRRSENGAGEHQSQASFYIFARIIRL